MSDPNKKPYTAQYLIEKLNLLPHPEGGYFKESYRSIGTIGSENLSDDYRGIRNHSTCIYFLLKADNISAFHQINQDEIWHFYTGTPIMLHIISETGQYNQHIISDQIHKGHVPQLVVPGNHWFGASLIKPDVNSYALVGCTVSPGFDFRDFKLPLRSELVELFPQHRTVIEQLTPR